MTLSRRSLMRRTAITGVTAVGIGAGAHHSGNSPIGRAQAVAPLAVAAGALAIGYLGWEVGNYLTGDSRDYGGYAEINVLQDELYSGALEMQSADERVMTSIQNNITNSENIALTKGKAAAVESMNNGDSESEAQTQMQNAIDEYYASIQENLLTHWSEQYTQLRDHIQAVVDHPDGTVDNDSSIFQSRIDGGDWRADSTETSAHNPRLGTYAAFFNTNEGDYTSENYAYDLLDGTTKAVPITWGPNLEFSPSLIDGNPDHTTWTAALVHNSSAETAVYVDTRPYNDAWDSIISSRDAVNSDLSGFVSDVYAQWEPGEIPTEDLIDPITAATEFDQDYDNTAFRSAQAAMLGIPTGDARSLTLEVLTDGSSYVVEADLYTQYTPRNELEVGTDIQSSISSGVIVLEMEPVADETYTVTTTDSETVDIAAADFVDNGDGTWQYDASGDLSTTATSVDTALGEDLGFTVGDGTIYDPTTWDSPAYIAYSYEGDRTFTELEDEFKIVEAIDSNGEQITEFSTKETNNETADVAEIRNEIDKLNETIADLREREEELATGGGGGSSGPGPLTWITNNPAIAAVGGVGLAALYKNLSE